LSFSARPGGLRIARHDAVAAVALGLLQALVGTAQARQVRTLLRVLWAMPR
jgi:hypothetical protein